MPALNETYTPANSITIGVSGVYELNFSLVATASVAAAVTVAVRANGANLPSTVISRLLAVGTDTVYSGSVIVSLAAGTVLDLALSALLALVVTLGSGVNATLTAKKLDA